MIFDKQMDKSNNSGEEKYTNISLKLSSKFMPKIEQLKKNGKSKRQVRLLRSY